MFQTIACCVFPYKHFLCQETINCMQQWTKADFPITDQFDSYKSQHLLVHTFALTWTQKKLNILVRYHFLGNKLLSAVYVIQLTFQYFDKVTNKQRSLHCQHVFVWSILHTCCFGYLVFCICVCV